MVLVLGPPGTCKSTVCCADARDDISARLAIPIPPSTRRRVSALGCTSLSCISYSRPVPLRYDKTRSAASDLTTADFAGSILLEDQSRRVTRTACKTVGRTVFSNVRPVFEVPVLVFRRNASQSPHFLKWEETNTMLITLECSATRQKGSRIVEQVDVSD